MLAHQRRRPQATVSNSDSNHTPPDCQHNFRPIHRLPTNPSTTHHHNFQFWHTNVENFRQQYPIQTPETLLQRSSTIADPFNLPPHLCSPLCRCCPPIFKLCTPLSTSALHRSQQSRVEHPIVPRRTGVVLTPTRGLSAPSLIFVIYLPKSYFCHRLCFSAVLCISPHMHSLFVTRTVDISINCGILRTIFPFLILSVPPVQWTPALSYHVVTSAEITLLILFRLAPLFAVVC